MSLSRVEIISLLATSDQSAIEALRVRAESTCLEVFDRDVHLRGIIEFSNYCRQDCLYCGLRRSNASQRRYRMDPKEIVRAAENAVALGYKTIVLQSGEDLYYSARDIAHLIEAIKSRLDVAVTLSLGQRDKAAYRSWAAAGADRYLMRHETSNPVLYAYMHPGHALDERLDHLHTLRDLEFQIGAGNMVGIPGQTVEDIANDLLLMKQLEVDMAGIGPFVPNPATPLGNARGGTLDLVFREIALLRVLLPETMIPSTTALDTLDPHGREMALRWGANVVMPNVTPTKYRRMYSLYPGKTCVDENPEQSANCMRLRIQARDRRIAAGHGHSPRYLKKEQPATQTWEVAQ